MRELDLHLHADHITGLGALQDRTHCITVMGDQGSVDVVSMRIADNDTLQIEGVNMDVIYTPATPMIHTAYSCRTPCSPVTR